MIISSIIILLVEATVPVNLINRLSFNDGTASNLAGNMFDGTLVNGAHVLNRKVVFDKVGANISVGSYLRLPNGLLYNTGATVGIITIETWVKLGPNNAQTNRIFQFGKQTAANPTYSCYRDGTTGKLCCFGSPTSTVKTICSTVPFNGTNVYLALVLDGNYGSMTLYLNGALISSTSFPSLALLSTDVFTLGAVDNQLLKTVPTTDGVMDEFRIWTGELTSSVVALNAALGPDNPINSEPSPSPLSL
jgi:hypothetical protein